MIQSKERQQILKGIRAGLIHGDMKDIAKDTGKSYVYVNMVLNVTRKEYNEEIVAAATKIIASRKKENKKILDVLGG